MIDNVRGVLAIAFATLATGTASPALADGNAGIEALKQRPLSLFSYGLAQLEQTVRGAFTSQPAPPFATFSAPLSGRIADIVTVLYEPGHDTVTVNMVKIDRLADGATADEACKQAMAAMRTYAFVDPATGKLQEGEESSALSMAFIPSGAIMDGAPADLTAMLDKSFELRFSGLTDKRFTCHAPLLGSGYSMSP